MDKETKKEMAEASPISTTMTEEEVKVMIEVFSKMGVKPKANTKEELEKWMAAYVQGLGLLPEGLPPPLPFATPVKAKPPGVSPPATTTEGATAGTSTVATTTTGSPETSTVTVTTSSVPPVVTSSTSAGTLVATRKPWLVKFAGQSSEGYTLWRHQLRSLMAEHHSSRDIADAIRSSLQGKAGDIVARLGTAASVEDIVRKMDSIYGEVDEEEDLLHLFYGARQEPDESVATWGCRLEGMLALLKKQGPLPRTENQMLRTMLWKGLRKDLQDLSGYKYDKVEDFDELRVVLRRIEKQQQERGTTGEKKPSKSAPVKSAQPSSEEDLRVMLQKLAADVATLKEAQYSKNPNSDNNNNSNKKNKGNWKNKGNNDGGQRPQYNKGNFRGGYSAGSSRNNTRYDRPPEQQQPPFYPQPQQQPTYPQPQQQLPPSQQDNSKVPSCYRCGQPGHIAIGCRVRMDHVRRPQDF